MMDLLAKEYICELEKSLKMVTLFNREYDRKF